MIAGYNAYDMTSALILITFAVLGLTGGLIRQITRLVALVLAGWAAMQYGPDMVDKTGMVFGPGTVVIIPLMTFLVVYFAVVVAGFIFLKLIKATSPAVGLWDRLLGMALGIIKGAIMIYILTAILIHAAGTSRIRGLGTSDSVVYEWVKKHPVTAAQVADMKDQIKFKVKRVIVETKKRVNDTTESVKNTKQQK